MAKTVHLQLTGEAEKLMNELAELGMSDRQIIAKAIGLLSIVHRTGRVAVLKRGREDLLEELDIVDYIFTLRPLDQVLAERLTGEQEEGQKRNRPRPARGLQPQEAVNAVEELRDRVRQASEEQSKAFRAAEASLRRAPEQQPKEGDEE